MADPYPDPSPTSDGGSEAAESPEEGVPALSPPRYACHKVVQALRLAAVGLPEEIGKPVVLVPEDERFDPVEVEHGSQLHWNIDLRHVEREGDPGYLVIGCETGAMSWLPTAKFERTFNRLDDDEGFITLGRATDGAAGH